MISYLFKNNSFSQRQPVDGTEKSILEHLTRTCQQINQYLQNTPGKQPCFINREAIAEDPQMFSLARSFTDARRVKFNVEVIAIPLLECLHFYIDKYWASVTNNQEEETLEVNQEKVLELYQLMNCAYWYVQKIKLSDESSLYELIANGRNALKAHCKLRGLVVDESSPIKGHFFVPRNAKQEKLREKYHQLVASFLHLEVSSEVSLVPKP